MSRRTRVRFDRYDLDLATGELKRAGHPVDLPPQPTKVLVELVSRAGSLVERAQLRHLVWGDGWVDWEAGLHQAIRCLRKTLGDDARHPRFIRTVPRRGYRFVCAVRPSGGTTRRRRLRMLRPWALVAAGLMIAAILPPPPDVAPPVPKAPTAVPATPSLKADSAPPSPEAWRLYREGLHLLQGGATLQAIDKLRLAAQSAPGWGAPWGAIAEAELQRPGEQRVASARAAIESALSRDPDEARAWRQLATLRLWEEWDWVGARAALDHATRVDADDADAWQLLASLETVAGNEEAALIAARRAVALEPVSTVRRADLGWTLYYFGHADRALAECRRGLDLDPHSPSALQCALQSLVVLGRRTEARSLVREAGKTDSGGDPLAAYLLRQIEALETGPSCASRAAVAVPRLMLGDPDGALDALVAGAREGRGWEVPFARQDPLFAPWRSDRRFDEIELALDARG